MKPCTQCGKCCQHYSDGGLSATSEEIDWWQIFRPEIARYVDDGQIWMHPETGERLPECPFLTADAARADEQSITSASAANAGGRVRYSCSIYHDRPDDCRHYPVSIDEMRRDGCEMLELRDLDNPIRAQRALDQLMSDSRPPLSGPVASTESGATQRAR
jgi:Fe-S-cluster containining protein